MIQTEGLNPPSVVFLYQRHRQCFVLFLARFLYCLEFIFIFLFCFRVHDFIFMSPTFPEFRHIMEDSQNATRFLYTMSDSPSYLTIVGKPSSVPGTSSRTDSMDDSVISFRSCTFTSSTDSTASNHILHNNQPPALTIPIQSYSSAVSAPLTQISTDTAHLESSGNKYFACKYSLLCISKDDLIFLKLFQVHREIRPLIGKYPQLDHSNENSITVTFYNEKQGRLLLAMTTLAGEPIKG